MCPDAPPAERDRTGRARLEERPGSLAVLDEREQGREEHDAHPVVDEAVALDEDREALGCAEFLEQRQHGDGVGRKDHRREQQRDDRVEREHLRTDHAQKRDGDDQPRDGYREDGRDVPAQSLEIGRGRTLEQEWREQDQQDEVVREFDLDGHPDDRRDDASQ